jgi:hypothetical protein
VDESEEGLRALGEPLRVGGSRLGEPVGHPLGVVEPSPVARRPVVTA